MKHDRPGTTAVVQRWEQPVLKRFPGLQKYCWSAVIVFENAIVGRNSER